MGLFGLGGYGKSTYDKNTAEIKAKISRISNIIAGTKFYGADVILTQALQQLTPYPADGDKKQLAVIDERILKLLDEIMLDAQREEPGKLSGHANMLFTAIAKSRKIGKEIYSAEQIEAQNCIAEANANIEQFLSEQEKITARLDAIKRKAKQIAQDNPNSIELKRLQIEHGTLTRELDNIEKNLNLAITNYNQNARVLSVMKDGEAYTQISRTTLKTPKDVAKLVQNVSQQLGKLVADQEETGSILDDYDQDKSEGVGSVATTSDGGLMDFINSGEDVNSDIFGATTTARTSGNATGDAPKTANWFD